jgi:hypothetical protein
MLATCSDDKLRDGMCVVELAAKTNEMSGGKDPAVLDALVTAHAKSGDFAPAVEFRRRRSPTRRSARIR